MLQIADIPAALLAGGLATRLRPVSQTIPKALMPVAGRTFIDHQLDLLYRSGIRSVVLCVGHLGEMLRDHVGDGAAYGLNARYSFDGDRLLGTGGAVRRALPLLGDLFWIMYADSYMEIDYRQVLADFDAHPKALGLMTGLHNAGQWDKSNVVFKNGQLLRYDKNANSPDMTYIDYGVAILKASAAQRLPADAPADLAQLYGKLVADGLMIGHEVKNRFYEIGTPASLAEADAYLRKSRPKG
jgi:NDP-sugar pyrophosphorylase family protein